LALALLGSGIMMLRRKKTGKVVRDFHFLDNEKTTRYYVFANAVEAIIYRDTYERKFEFIQRISNPRGTLRDSDLGSDRPGKSYSSAGNGTIHHALTQKVSQHDQISRDFARKITARLCSIHFSEKFNELVLIAGPRFLGLLRQTLPKTIRSLVRLEVHHQYVFVSDQALAKSIQKATSKIAPTVGKDY